MSILTEAWSSICPEKSFFGMTLDQYKESVKPATTSARKSWRRSRLPWRIAMPGPAFYAAATRVWMSPGNNGGSGQ